MAETDNSTPTVSAAEQEVIDAEAAQWGHWTANGPIYLDGVLAFAAGHDVPVQHVEKFQLDKQGLVRAAGEPAAEPTPAAYVAAPVGQTVNGNPPSPKKK